MAVQIHGFDWAVYAERVMPAFAPWLMDSDERAVYELFKHTRCAREEAFLPEPMKRLSAWARAETFVDGLPRGPHSLREYAKLCSVEQFTALSDSYLHRHAPHLYQNSDALRIIWGAIIEEYCLPWRSVLENEASSWKGEADATRSFQEWAVPENAMISLIQTRDAEDASSLDVPSEQVIIPLRGELISLLHEAGLGELAQEVSEQEIAPVMMATTGISHIEQVSVDDQEDDLDEEDDEPGPRGIFIGEHANILHLRGWLAGTSVRAFALFEYLTCERRCMPFGYEAGEPFGGYAGYLTPDEVWYLANCLHDVQPPGQEEAEEDELRFRRDALKPQQPSRLVDEVLPTYAAEFLQVVRAAALQGLGLICRVE